MGSIELCNNPTSSGRTEWNHLVKRAPSLSMVLPSLWLRDPAWQGWSWGALMGGGDMHKKKGKMEARDEEESIRCNAGDEEIDVSKTGD